MNTPTHMIVSYALLSDKAVSKKDKVMILLGGVVPDVVIFFLFFYALAVGIPMRTLWDETYFEPGWQLAIDLFNSFPLFIALAVVGWMIKKRWLLLFSLSMCLHFIADFFTHADDAHRHFLPVSNFKFESPMSYWDPRHFGEVGSTLELGIIIFCSWFLWSRLRSAWSRIAVVGYVVLSVFALFMFNLML